MSKERLEEIAYNVDISLDGEKALMSIGDYDFLYNYALQQAERVEELEIQLSINTNNMKQLQKEKDEWKDTAKSYYMTNQELREQNQRYREAFEKIKLNVKICGNEEYFPKVVEEIVNEALEGEQ